MTGIRAKGEGRVERVAAPLLHPTHSSGIFVWKEFLGGCTKLATRDSFTYIYWLVKEEQ
jgi:hypothetical protein